MPRNQRRPKGSSRKKSRDNINSAPPPHPSRSLLGGPSMADAADLYATLGVPRDATEKEIRRRYRNLITKEHPDKGGSADKFAQIQRSVPPYKTTSLMRDDFQHCPPDHPAHD